MKILFNLAPEHVVLEKLDERWSLIDWLFSKFATHLATMASSMSMRQGILHTTIVTAWMILAAVCPCAAKDFVVVIDAGHGGHDYGAIDNGVREKDINLGVALKLGRKIDKEHKDVKVVYTRDDDYFISLQERANRANKAHGDLFISIHTNSVDAKSKSRKTVCGASTYTLGLHRTAENLAVAKRENSVMMLEKDYSTTYCGFDPNSSESYIMFELNQNKHMEQSVDFASYVQEGLSDKASRVDKGVRQAGFWVLAATSMPAVLVELDFICNPSSARFLSSENGQKKLAEGIYTAFCEYKEDYDHQMAAAQGKIKPTKEKKDKKAGKKDKRQKQSEKEAATKSATPQERADANDSEEESSKSADRGKSDDVRKEKNEKSRGTVFKIQFLTSSTVIAEGASRLKGLDGVDYYRDGGMYKYTCGEFKDWNSAVRMLRKVKKKFPDAFITTFKDGKRVR